MSRPESNAQLPSENPSWIEQRLLRPLKRAVALSKCPTPMRMEMRSGCSRSNSDPHCFTIPALRLLREAALHVNTPSRAGTMTSV